jgi:hypothetical protein
LAEPAVLALLSEHCDRGILGQLDGRGRTPLDIMVEGGADDESLAAMVGDLNGDAPGGELQQDSLKVFALVKRARGAEARSRTATGAASRREAMAEALGLARQVDALRTPELRELAPATLLDCRRLMAQGMLDGADFGGAEAEARGMLGETRNGDQIGLAQKLLGKALQGQWRLAEAAAALEAAAAAVDCFDTGRYSDGELAACQRFEYEVAELRRRNVAKAEGAAADFRLQLERGRKQLARCEYAAAAAVLAPLPRRLPETAGLGEGVAAELGEMLRRAEQASPEEAEACEARLKSAHSGVFVWDANGADRGKFCFGPEELDGALGGASFTVAVAFEVTRFPTPAQGWKTVVDRTDGKSGSQGSSSPREIV